MKNIIIAVVALIVIVYTGSQVVTMLTAKNEFAKKVEKSLDFVDEASIKTLPAELVQEGKKFGIDVKPENIHILYEGTDIRSYAQQVVGQKVGVQFKNKRVNIKLQYTARVDGFPIAQEISETKIRQVERPQAPTSKATQELLDSQ